MSGPDRFAELRGHPGVVEALSRALDEDRLSPALLFHGPAGVGKLTAGMELARSLLCLGDAPRPCRQCDACRRLSASALLHPDVGLLYPQRKRDVEEKRAKDEAPPTAPDLHAIQEEVRRNPSWKILAEPARERLGELFLSPAGGRRRLLLILASERLQEESGNALLKVLEEPPPSALLLLLCENPRTLLPTLRSRCQSYRFGTLSRGTIARFLSGAPRLPPDQATLLASLSGGQLGRGLALAEEVGTYRERRAALTRVLSEARRQKTAAAALIAAAGITADQDRIQEDLAILGDLLRDSMLAGCGCDAALLTEPRGAAESPDGFLFPPLEAAALLGRLERAREDLRHFVNRQLALESLFLDLVNPLTSPLGEE